MLQEIFLDVASFVDYGTLVMLKLSNEGLLRFVERHSDKLAVQRVFRIECHRDELKVYDTLDGWRAIPIVVNVDANDTERTAALAEVKAIVRPHDVVQKTHLYEANIPIRSLVDAIPGIRDTFDVFVAGPPSTAERYVEDICEFGGPQRMHLADMPLNGLLALTRHDCTSKVTEFTATPPPHEIGTIVDTDAESAILRFCMDYDNLREHETKSITLEHWNFRWTFVERLIEALTQSDRLRTVTIAIPEGLTERTLEMGNGFPVYYWELPLSDAFSEKQCVGINDFLRLALRWLKLAHFSRHRDVAVFVTGFNITVTNNPKHIEIETKNYTTFH